MARHELTQFIQWTVYARSLAIVFFGAFVALGRAPMPLLLFGVVDLAAALWTEASLRRDAATATG